MTGARRPLASRDTGLARALAARLAASRVTPNAISAASMVAAALAGGALWASGSLGGGARGAALVLAALGCQIRLACNLLDGMVAVEGGRAAPDGPFWNEAPDRVSDLLILGGCGLGLGMPGLGWAAAALAVLTAYLRELGAGLGRPADFGGPMAKPQRMAAITLGAIAALLDPLWGGSALALALWAVALGAALTAGLRSARLVVWLRARR